MKKIRLYDWHDTEKQRVLREVEVLRTDDLTRNGKERIYVWSMGGEEYNLTLYPQYGTAYPEHDNRIQQQRIAERFFYDVVE